ncbi:MAG: tRNA (adenosine(37)-N6)-threonylcarbamoyltransferase complex ATPase subunit type 1 TsaE [Burkholderiales bacterium]
MKPDPVTPKFNPGLPEPGFGAAKLDPVILLLPDLAATQGLAERLAPHLRPGLRVGLQGGLGAGKTTFVRALLLAMGHRGRVRSPTFTLHEPYECRGQTVHHFDLYRFGDPREWLDAGFDDLIGSQAISLIEWPQMAQGVLPECDLDIVLEPLGDTGLDDSPEAESGRRVSLIAHSQRGQVCLHAAGF